MAEKVDYKKKDRHLYFPPTHPVILSVPSMKFLAVEGNGSPQGEEYQQAIRLLYSTSFTIKMSRISGNSPNGYHEYVVPPLEGLWELGPSGFDFSHKEDWKWISLIRQPDFVTPQVLMWAKQEAARKKGDSMDFSRIRLITLEEGLCVQMMHVGPYEDEPASFEKIQTFLEQNHYRDLSLSGCRHHEIYLSDPRRIAPERLKTVLRHPVAPIV